MPHELVELALGCAGEFQLHGSPVGGVDLLLRLWWEVHQDVVADEVGLGELLACRVHGLEDELRVVHAAFELHVDHHQLVQTATHDREVEGWIGELAAEVAVVLYHPCRLAWRGFSALQE